MHKSQERGNPASCMNDLFFLVAWLVIATLPAKRRSGESDYLTQIEESRTQGGEKVQNKIVSIIASGACSQSTHIFNQNGKKDKR